MIKYRTILTQPNADDTLCSKKVLFLYRDNLHYELISFKYKYQNDVVQRINRMESIYFTIFDTSLRTNYLPPYHILILLYGSSFIYTPEEVRQKYIYKNLMSEINRSATALVIDKNQAFINDFNTIFDMQKSTKKSIEHYVESDDINGGQPLYKNRYITKKPEANLFQYVERDMSKLSYSITIDMEVQPGISLTPEQINESKCKSKYNAIRKAYSEFTGKPYVIPPLYKQNTYVPITNKSTNYEKQKFNNTRKRIRNRARLEGKRNKTIKRR